MWTGWVGNDGKGGGPVIDNAEAGYDWTTYPERLQKAGVSWKIYQDIGDGLDAAGSWGWTDDAYIGNYGDNSLLYFHQYQNATARRARCTTRPAPAPTSQTPGDGFFDQLARRRPGTAGCRRSPGSSRPRRSPSTRTGRPNYGAWYISQVLDALTSDPEVWSKTALFITYDENDGFFDHIVPPYPNVGGLPRRLDGRRSTNELFAGDATARRRPVRPRHRACR